MNDQNILYYLATAIVTNVINLIFVVVVVALPIEYLDSIVKMSQFWESSRLTLQTYQRWRTQTKRMKTKKVIKRNKMNRLITLLKHSSTSLNNLSQL